MRDRSETINHIVRKLVAFYILIRAERLEHMKKDEKQREQKNKCVSRIMDNFSLKNENM